MIRNKAEAPGAPHLHFVGWERPALWLAAELLAEWYGEGRELDLRHVLVALPGRRAGRRLLEILLERAEAGDRALRPPRIATPGVLAEILEPPERPMPSALRLRRVWAQALRSLPAGDRRRLLARPPEPDDLVRWMALADTMVELQATVGAGGHSFGDVAERCAEGLLFNDEERWRVLSQVQERVWRELDGAGMTDREVHRRRVAEAVEAGTGEDDRSGRGDLWLVGLAEMPGILRRILVRPLQEGRLHAVVHAPPELAEGFDELGCVRPEFWANRRSGVPDETIRLEGGPRDQAGRVVEELRRVVQSPGDRDAVDAGHSDPPAPEDVSIGVPDAEVIPFLADALGEVGVDARDPAGRPLERTLPFRLLESVARYLAEGSWEALASLLRHPDLADHIRGAVGPGAHLSVLDAYHALHLPARLSEGDLPRAGERSSRPLAPAVTRLRDELHGRLLAPLRRTRPLSEWLDPVVDVFLAVYGHRTLDPHQPEDRDVKEVAEGMREALEAMEELPAGLDDPVDGATALRLVLHHLRGREVAPPAEDDAVELLGWLELHLDDAPILMVTGVNEPHVPESVTSHPFLPHGLRTRLGLLDNPRRWARDLYQLQAILASRPEVVLISGRRTATGDPLRPSRLLLAEEGERLARRIRDFLAEGEAAPVPEPAADPGAGGAAAAGSADEEADPFRLPPEPEIRAAAPPESLAVTDFRAFLRDPYAFALERVLGLESVDDVGREMDPMAFGVLAHQVLERFGRSQAAASSRADTVADALDRILDQEARARFGPHPHPAVRIQVEQLRGRLRTFARWQADWIAQGWRTRGVEVRPAGEGHRFPVDGRPFHIRGRIDRVDHHPPSGRWVLFDYKTSARARTPEETHRRKAGRKKDDPMEWVDLQLPLYRHLIRGVQDPEGGPLVPLEEVEGVELGFICLPADLEAVGHALAQEWGPADLLEADERAREVVRALRENRFVWDPEGSRIRADSALGRLVGLAAYRELDDEEEDGEGVE